MFWTRTTFLLLAAALTAALVANAQDPGFEECNLGCPSNPSVLGFSTLGDLRCAMNLERDRVRDAAPNRNPPFVYQLCPNTVYKVATAQDVIIPQLQRTVVQCGPLGRSIDSCVIDGSFDGRQVLVDQSVEQVMLPGTDSTVEFIGLTFENPQGTDNKRVTSIDAGIPVQIQLSLTDCHWRNLVNMAAIRNVGSFVDGERAPAMRVSVTDSTFRDTEHTLTVNETYGLLTTRGNLNLVNVNMTNFNASVLVDSVNSNVVWRGGVIEDCTLKDPRGFNDAFLDHDSLLTLEGLTATRNTFNNFVYVQSDGTADLINTDIYSNAPCNTVLFQTQTGRAISLMDSFIEAEASAGMIRVSGFGTGADLTLDRTILDSRFSQFAIYSFAQTSLNQVCVHGQTTFAPIFISGGEERLTFNELYMDLIVVGTSEVDCDEIFVEDNGSSCIANPTACMDGTCLSSDAAECFDAQMPPAPRCDNVCRVIPNVEQCMENLRDLKCAMCTEAAALSAGSPLRPSAPYVYELCENTRFVITDEEVETIYPMLDQTVFRCGTNGAQSGNCTIEGGLLHVEISQQSRAINFPTSPEPVETVEFQGIHFTRTVVDPRYRRSASIWARGQQGITATFGDCRWSEVGGTHTILNQNPALFGDFDGSSGPAMTVNLNDCTFDDSSESFDHHGVLSTHGEINMNGVEFVNYLAPIRILGVHNQATVSLDNVNLTNCGIPSSSLYFRDARMIDIAGSSTFKAYQVIIKGDSNVQTHPGGIIVAHNSTVEVDRTLFQNDLDTTLAVGGFSSSTLAVADSCFVNSRLSYLIYGTDGSNIVSNNNFEGFFLDTNCRGTFEESEGTGCIDPTVGGCDGQCTPFDSMGTDCPALLPMPTATPPPTPLPSTPSPTQPGATRAPTREPTLAPVVLTPFPTFESASSATTIQCWRHGMTTMGVFFLSSIIVLI